MLIPTQTIPALTIFGNYNRKYAILKLMSNSNVQKGLVAPLVIIIAVVVGIIGTLLFKQTNNTAQNTLSSSPTQTPSPTPTQTSTPTATSSGTETEATKPATFNPRPMDAPADESVFKAVNVTDTQPKEADNRTDAQRQQELNQRDQDGTKEGIASNIINQNFTTFDFRAIDFPLSTPRPSNNSILYNAIGRLRALNINPSPSPALSPTPTTQTSNDKKWAMVVILNWVLIHDDKDPASNGEAQFVIGAKSGDIEQHSAAPFVNWYEVNNGSKAKVNRPIFVAPWDKLGDKVAIWISAVDNDSLPEWANDIIKKSTSLYNGLGLLYQTGAASQANSFVTNSFLGWLGSEEHIGTLTKVLSKSDNYGFGQGPFTKEYEERFGDATFNYDVVRVPIPQKPLKVDIALKKIYGGETGDYDYAGGDGDLYIWTLASDGFAGGSELNAQTKRIPGDGTHGLEDHHDWNVDTNIFSHVTNSPVVFYEVGVWDKDPTSNDDELAIASFRTFPGLIELYSSQGNYIDTVKHDRDGDFPADEGLDADADVEVETKTTSVDSLF